MNSPETLLLIDGHALAYRYYFALEMTGMKTPENKPTWAVFGFFKCIFDLLEEKKVSPDLIAVTFDVGKRTFRTEMFDDYKANRESMPDALHSQLSTIIDGLCAFNIPVYTKEGFEADDVIGTISKIAEQKGVKTMILTGDRDSFQLVDDLKGTSVIMPSKGDVVVYDRDKVFERMGVYPEQIVDFKGLSGDTSDNIPGIRGIGDKTAAKLLAQFGTLENIYEHIDEVSGKALKQKLIDGKDDAILSKTLATICRDVEVDFDFEHTKKLLPDVEKVTKFFQENAFYGFLKNLNGILKHFEVENAEEFTGTTVQNPAADKNSACQLTLNFLEQTVENSHKEYDVTREIVDTEDKLNNLAETLKTKLLISVDTETTGLNPLVDDVVGISIAFNDNIVAKNGRVKVLSDFENVTHSYYIPVSHNSGNQVSRGKIKQALFPIFENPEIAKTMQNAKFDINVLRKFGVRTKGLIFDTMLASYIKDSSRKHGLKIQSTEHLGYLMTNFDEVTEKSFDIAAQDIEKAGQYACDDAFVTLELSRFWSTNLSEKELDLLYDIEVPVTEVLADMEFTGVKIDRDYLNCLSDETKTELALKESEIFAEAGLRFNINSPKQVSDVLFNKLELKAKAKKKKGGVRSTNADVLESLAKDNKIAADILDYRHIAKLKSSYIDALPLLILPSDGKIHTSFNQTVTSTGRLSSSNPNLQNIPVKTEEGAKIRQAFVPSDDNRLILSADYSQIELRMMAHCSQDENLLNAFNDDVDVHALTASKIYEVPLEAVTKEMRNKAKTVNFGIIYGQSKYGLASALGFSSTEAEEFMAKYFATYPGISRYMKETVEFASQNGYVETIFGRKRMIDVFVSKAQAREAAIRAAVNAPLQGSAADIMKLAMVKTFNAFERNNLSSKIIIQVHDELVVDMLKSEKDTVVNIIKDSMENVYPLTVPLKVDMAIGNSLKET